MTLELAAKIERAAQYLENGDPWFDVLNDADIVDIIIGLNNKFKSTVDLSIDG